MAREPLGFFPRLRTPQLPATHAREGTDHRARAWDHVIGIADLLTIHLQHATSCRTPEFVPFLRFDTEIRTVVCTTNAIESINARIRRAVNARGHFPTEQAALKCVYLAIMSLDPKGTGRKRWSNRWKSALNAFEMTFDGRLSARRQ
jgi:transposase-like protein